MTKDELDILVSESLSEILGNTPEKVQRIMLSKLKKYSSADGKISLEQATTFCYMESISLNAKLLRSVLGKIFVKDSEKFVAKDSIE